MPGSSLLVEPSPSPPAPFDPAQQTSISLRVHREQVRPIGTAGGLVAEKRPDQTVDDDQLLVIDRH